MNFKANLSLEFFPPRDLAAQAQLIKTLDRLHILQPHYVSVTFGAGGSTREGTAQTVSTLLALGYEAAPHLSCVGASRADLRQILHHYRAQGVRRIVALRGDLPSGMGLSEHHELRYASDLVAFIREETGEAFHIEVAAYPEMHPQASNASADLAYFVAKVRAGANGAITQYFFNADAYFAFVDNVRAAGLNVPIIPGIMPITNNSQLTRFSAMCGAEIPRWIRLKLDQYGDDRNSIRAFGTEVMTAMCQRLLDQGVAGLHFYTLNQAEPVLDICHGLGLME